ncbi:MAG: hypothetical protein ACK47B_04595 [Armatimonadota bacterium]
MRYEDDPRSESPRRRFLKQTTLALGGGLLASAVPADAARKQPPAPPQGASAPVELPVGDAPAPVPFPHFPSRLHAFVWRNWQLVPAERMGRVVGATAAQIRELGRELGLSGPPRITADQQRRSYISVIKRNWHLLPYEQLLQLLDWDAEELAFTLREDDFLYVKLGSRKPRCETLRYAAPDPETRRRAAEVARVVREQFGEGAGTIREPLFQFVTELSRPPEKRERVEAGASGFSPRYCYSYFALYGDPLLEREADPFPDGYLARLADAGVGGVWLQGLLQKLAPFPWEPTRSARWEERLQGLKRLAARAKRHDLGLYLYLNEPRALPLSWFETRPHLKGVVEGDYATLCTSVPEVRAYLTGAVERICRTVPELAGLFTISGSENLTHCWSHGRGTECPRCGPRGAAVVTAEANALIQEGIDRARSKTRLLVWDWGWADDWAEEAIRRLPKQSMLMSVSEWSIPIRRGGVESVVGEYSISTVGPGPRATRHWQAARAAGLGTMAKIQAGNTWELSAVPYIPAVENVAQHAANLRGSGVRGLMLGWTLGGYPSPNLEVVSELGRHQELTPEGAIARVAERRFGPAAAPHVVRAWRAWSAAFREFPYHIGVVYNAPLQTGPANPLWAERTGYGATMVGFPYDDLASWRSVFPPDVFIGQLERVADGFDAGLRDLRAQTEALGGKASREQRRELAREQDVAEAAAIHFRSVANQARFVRDRDALAAEREPARVAALCDQLETTLRSEIALAKRLYQIQQRDSRIGFEATNHYYYVPADLVEKVVNCQALLDGWLKSQRDGVVGRGG